jgi:hypothetical protein
MKHLFLAIMLVFSFSAFAQATAQDKSTDQTGTQQVNKEQVNKELEIKSVPGGECHDTSMASCAATVGDMPKDQAENAKNEVIPPADAKKGKESGKAFDAQE